MWRERRALTALAQLGGTLGILAWVPGNTFKLLGFLALWGVSFGRLTARELMLACGGATLFSVLDILTIRRGVFTFCHPDGFGLPIYEPALWGFYLVHMQRVLAGVSVERADRRCWIVLALFAPMFSLFTTDATILLASGAVLSVALFLWHRPADLAYAGYAVLLGAAIEYVGVYADQWRYPAPPAGGVPLWFITMWAGVGFFLHRLVLAGTHDPHQVPLPQEEPRAPDLIARAPALMQATEAPAPRQRTLS